MTERFPVQLMSERRGPAYVEDDELLANVPSDSVIEAMRGFTRWPMPIVLREARLRVGTLKAIAQHMRDARGSGDDAALGEEISLLGHYLGELEAVLTEEFDR